jgi:GT2 family glycosyltransferase
LSRSALPGKQSQPRADDRSAATSTPTEAEPGGNTALAQAASSAVPLLSVLIVSFECRQELEACLRSIEQERDSLRLEVIVVDNASTDRTVAAVSRRFPWVRLVANAENVGFARGANQAMALARGAFFLLLNPDTVIPNGSFATALSTLSERPDVGMIGCKLVRPDGSFDHACKRGFPTIASSLYYFLGLGRLMPKSPRFAHYTAGGLDPDEVGLVDAVNGAFMLVRREAVEDVGRMDERFWLYAEDLDWCRRFWERDWKILYCPEAVVIHIKSASAGDHRSLKLNLAFHHSIWLFYGKYHAATHRRLTTLIVFAGIWTKFVVSVVRNAVRKTLRAFRPRPRRRGPGNERPLSTD